MPFEHRLRVERGQQFARHLDLFAQARQSFGGHVLVQKRIVEAVDLDAFRDLVAVGAVHQLQPIAQDVVAA